MRYQHGPGAHGQITEVMHDFKGQENQQDGIHMYSHQLPNVKSWNLFMVLNNEH